MDHRTGKYTCVRVEYYSVVFKIFHSFMNICNRLFLRKRAASLSNNEGFNSFCKKNMESFDYEESVIRLRPVSMFWTYISAGSTQKILNTCKYIASHGWEVVQKAHWLFAFKFHSKPKCSMFYVENVCNDLYVARDHSMHTVGRRLLDGIVQLSSMWKHVPKASLWSFFVAQNEINIFHAITTGRGINSFYSEALIFILLNQKLPQNE